MPLIPASGKPIDLKLSDIKSETDAKLVVEWLDATISDMQRQLDNLDGDDVWRKKVLAAMRKTGETRVKVVEILLEARRELDFAIVFQAIAEETLAPEDYARIFEEARARRPDLLGVDSLKRQASKPKKSSTER